MAGVIDECVLEDSDETPPPVPPERRPSIERELLSIPWYHPDLTRHQAEAELQLSDEGVYLMRPRFDRKTGVVHGYALDIRCSRSVKHFKVDVNGSKLIFGQETFADIQSFIAHFDNCPLVGGDDGKLMLCQYPYPRDIDEIHEYGIVTTHFVPRTSVPVDRVRGSYDVMCCRRPKKPSQELHHARTRESYSLASKEGYLTKLGGVRKNWKQRWFVLNNDELSYYAKERDSEPIKVLKLKEVKEVATADVPNRTNVFRVVLPWRIFYLQASCPEVRQEWIRILQWKLEELENSKTKDDQLSRST